MQSDIDILRDLTARYLDICHHPRQAVCRDLWRRKNSLHPVPPLIYVRAFAWQEMPASRCLCRDPFFRTYEDFFRQMLFRSTFQDDFIFEPWVTVGAVFEHQGWGIASTRHAGDEPGGSFKIKYALRDISDLSQLRFHGHRINEAATAASVQKICDAIGDLISVNVDRAPAYRMWTGDLSTDLGYLRGIENFMLDMMDVPEALHRLMAFLRDGVRTAQTQAEAAGDWNLSAHQNQAMPYAETLPDPAPNHSGAARSQLWYFAASQEFTLVGPEQWNEFLLQYQIPILEAFGLTAYGCCEDLTRKIPYLRKIRNLRRIAVSPFANVAECARQIGRDYVLSYRPSPADMVAYGFDEDRITRILRRDLAACKNCHCDITLKDVETVQGDPERIKKWVRLVRRLIDEAA